MSRGSIGLDERLNAYVAGSHAAEHPVLAKLRKKTAPMAMSIMQIAPEQAMFLQFLVRLIGAKRTLEIGTFTGYSALAVALALPARGKVIALDISREWTDVGRPYWQEAGVAGKIELRLAPALESLAKLEREGATFDLAFIDAEKSEYDAYYESCLKLVRKDGLIVFDNMLQSGNVADPKDRGKSTAAIRALNRKLAADDRVDAVLLPLGDGVTLARVK
jgi:predicted O-methyltransferase YrrM